MYRLKIETRKLYWLHARYGTFKVRRKYARRTLRHERRLCKCTPHFLRRFSNGTETFFWPLLYARMSRKPLFGWLYERNLGWNLPHSTFGVDVL